MTEISDILAFSRRCLKQIADSWDADQKLLIKKKKLKTSPLRVFF